MVRKRKRGEGLGREGRREGWSGKGERGRGGEGETTRAPAVEAAPPTICSSAHCDLAVALARSC